MCSQHKPFGAHPSTALTPPCMAQNNLGIAEKLKHFFSKSDIQVLGWKSTEDFGGHHSAGLKIQTGGSRLDPQGICVLSTKNAWFYTIPPACRGFGVCFLYNSSLGAANHFCNADNMHKSFHCHYHHNHWQNSIIKFTATPLFCSVCCYPRDEYQTLCRQLDFLCH